MGNSLLILVLATCLMFSAVCVEGGSIACTYSSEKGRECKESSGDSAYATSTSGDGRAYAGPAVVVPVYPFPMQDFPFGGRRR